MGSHGIVRWMLGVVLAGSWGSVGLGAQGVHLTTYHESSSGERILVSQEFLPHLRAIEGIEERRFPALVVEHEANVDGAAIVELRASDPSLIDTRLKDRQVQPAPASDPRPAADEVVTLVDSGPSNNRIDLVFMGDGYTASEREKFFTDMQRLTDDLFSGQTFASYLPVFNVHAVFRASRDSGIGRNYPKDTAYGLYRQGNTLRAIYPSDTSAARDSCAKAPGCDYPIIIANDPYYGGLGGEFAISTSSPTSGSMVLRHELGHNFGRVGEEYDGGGYFGANYSRTVGGLKWRHWLDEESELRAEPGRALKLDWPWHNLSGGPYRANFRSSGQAAYFELHFSASGFASDGEIQATLDGSPLAIESPGYEDRAFHEIFQEGGLSSGDHTIEFRENVSDGNNWLSSFEIYEYDADYNFAPGFIGAFPVHGRSGSVAGYRSNHQTCLMREMKSVHFCAICIENNWLEFFKRISPIDDVYISAEESETKVGVQIPALGAFRDREALAGERLEIYWFRNGLEVAELRGQAEWSAPAGEADGSWKVEVKFVTPEVRKDSARRLEATREFEI